MPVLVASSTCVTIDASTSVCQYFEATSTPIKTQDSGDMLYMLAWIIFFMAVIFMGFVFNTFRMYGR